MIKYNSKVVKTKLKEYEKICPFCNGAGIIPRAVTELWLCLKCNGRGKIDWIDKIKGIKKL